MSWGLKTYDKNGRVLLDIDETYSSFLFEREYSFTTPDNERIDLAGDLPDPKLTSSFAIFQILESRITGRDISRPYRTNLTLNFAHPYINVDWKNPPNMPARATYFLKFNVIFIVGG